MRADGSLTGNPAQAAALGEVYRVSGFQGFLQSWVEMRQRDPSALIHPYQTARLFVLLGKKNEALSMLQKGFTVREGPMVYLKCDSVFDPIRSDPGFQAIVKKNEFPRINLGSRTKVPCSGRVRINSIKVAMSDFVLLRSSAPLLDFGGEIGVHQCRAPVRS